MENDENKNCLIIEEDNDEQNLKSCYKLDYKGQSINSEEFKKWKKDMLEKYGKDAKLFKCKDDNILFYITNKECKSIPKYKYDCPFCKKSICYFCSKLTNKEDNCGRCCIKIRIINLFTDSAYIFFKGGYDDYKYMRFLLLIPLFNLLYLINMISINLFYGLYDKTKEKKESGSTDTYEHRIGYLDENKNCLFILIIILNALCAIMLGICFTLLFSYFVSFIFLISIIFKEYPSKYIVGILYDGYRI